MEAYDLTGQRFGALRAIRVVRSGKGREWLCQCDCGNTRICRACDLRSGRIQSCGCLQREDLTGQKIGRLTALRRTRGADGRTRYEVICECGSTLEVSPWAWKKGRVKSCGCLRTHNPLYEARPHLPDGIAVRNVVIRRYKTNAKQRGLSFALTAEQMANLFASPCHYCGAPPGTTTTVKGRQGSFTYTGIDRLDNAEGYIPENVVPCCQECNYRKGAQSYEDFLGWVERVYQHRIAPFEHQSNERSAS
jgi:hypothetical protein